LRRRKGRNDTLLSETDLPLPTSEAALAPFIGGADHTFYTRMFSLDHERLRQGGKAILQAQDNVGQMLFSASAGIAGLRERLKEMEEEADALWAVTDISVYRMLTDLRGWTAQQYQDWIADTIARLVDDRPARA